MRRSVRVPLLLLVLGAACDRTDGANASSEEATGEAIIDLGVAGTVDAGYTLGRSDAPIAVVEFSDFGCPYCARFSRISFPPLRAGYVETGQVRWRFVPVVFGFAGGEVMGAAAVCAAELGGDDTFWRVHDVLYRNQTGLRGPDSRPRVLDLGERVGLDREDLDTCMADSATRQTLAANTRVARDWYVRGTPTFLINGVPMSGAMPPEVFARVFATVLDPSGL